MISGFILIGDEPRSFLLRALGPSLAAYGIGGVLLDPTIELHNGNGALIASDDDWKQIQQTEIEATGLAPTDDREAAIVVTLSPGSYTAIEGRSSGITFVETYTLPYGGDPLNPAPVPIPTPTPTPPPMGPLLPLASCRTTTHPRYGP